MLFGSAMLSFGIAVLGQPANDNLANRTVLSGTNLTATGSNCEATSEPSEPSSDWFTNSVWYEWTSPMQGTLRLTVSGSTFAPAVIIYSMGSDAHLYWLDGAANLPAEIDRIVYPGTRILIAVGGPNGASGDFQLKLEVLGEPPNDSFAQRIHLGSGPCRTNGWLFLAQDQAVWYSWTAPSNGPVTFTIAEQGLALSVFSGSTSSELQLLASSEGRSYVEGTQATIEAQAGVTYVAEVKLPYSSWTSLFTLSVSLDRPPLVALRRLPDSSPYLGEHSFYEAQTFDPDGRVERVDFYAAKETSYGRDYSAVATDFSWPFQCELTNLPYLPSCLVAVATDDQGAKTMSLPLALSSFPYNDAFANRLVLSGSSVTATGWLAGATREQFEPSPPDALGGSVWFTWSAPFSGTVTMQAGLPDAGPILGFEYAIGIFTGSELAMLTLATNGSPPLIFNVSAGTVYQIAVYGSDYPVPFPFSITQSAPPKVELTGPAADTRWPSGAQVPITAVPLDDGSIDRVDFYLDSNLIGSITNPPYTLLYTVPEIPYSSVVTLIAVAFDDDGLSAKSAGVPVLFAPRAPPNDDFTNAVQLTGSSFSLAVEVQHATLETDEPNGVPSVWYSWIAPSSRVVTLRAGPISAGVNLGIFTGTAVNGLTLVGQASPDPVAQDQVTVSFPAVPGVEYRIAVCAGWWNTGPITLEMVASAPPTITLLSPTNNARFSNGSTVQFSAEAIDSDGAIQHVEFYENGALVGISTNFPYQCAVLLTNQYGTAWRSAWAVAVDDSGLAQRSFETQFGIDATPPANDHFPDRTLLTGSFLSVTGTTASATWEPGEPGTPGNGCVWWSWQAPQTGPTTIVLGADEHWAQLAVFRGDSPGNLNLVTNSSSSPLPGVVTFVAEAGQQYQLAVNYVLAYGGPIWMAIGQSEPPTVTITSPPNSASFISGDPIPLSAATFAPSGEVREVTFFDDYYRKVLAVVTNPPWSATVFLTNTSSLEFDVHVRAKVTDSHGLIGYSDVRTFRVVVRRPANDLFENRLALDGCSLVVTGSTVLATDSSGWWSWTAPQDGWLTLDGQGCGRGDTFFGVYTGSQRTNLMLIASTNLSWYSSGRLAFPVSSGTAYAIEMATPYYMDGAAIQWNLHCGAPSTITIVSPADGQRILIGSSILVSARAETPDSSHPDLELYLDDRLVQTLTNPSSPAMITLPAPELGTHTVQVMAVNEYGVVSSSPSVLFAVIPPPPANDLFANRFLLHGFLASAPADTLYATREPGEPDPFGTPEWGTLWYSWTAPASGLLRVQSDAQYPLLSLWTGSSLSELQLIATNLTWEIAAPVTRGTTYQIACARTTKPLNLVLETTDYALIAPGGLTSDGLFKFTFETLYQQPWVIEGSVDLHQWTPIETNNTLRNVFEFVDTESGLYPKRFYRVRPE